MFTEIYYITEAFTRLGLYIYNLIHRVPPPAPPAPEPVPGEYAITPFEVVGFRKGTKTPRLVVPVVDGIGLRYWQEVRPVQSQGFRVFLSSEEVAEMPSERFFEYIERLAERARRK
jgi:hypothetical protein